MALLATEAASSRFAATAKPRRSVMALHEGAECRETCRVPPQVSCPAQVTRFHRFWLCGEVLLGPGVVSCGWWGRLTGPLYVALGQSCSMIHDRSAAGRGVVMDHSEGPGQTAKKGCGSDERTCGSRRHGEGLKSAGSGSASGMARVRRWARGHCWAIVRARNI